MNTDYLLKHVSYRLHTIVRKYSKSNDCINSFCAIHDFSDILLQNSERTIPFLKQFDNCTKMILVNEQIIYGLVVTDDSKFLIGPLRSDGTVSAKNKCEIEGSITDDWLESIPLCDYDELVTNLLLIHNLYHDNTMDLNDFTEKNTESEQAIHRVRHEFANILFENREIGSKHNPYDQEVREVSSIRNGDPEQLRISWGEDYAGNLGVLAKDRLRNYKNLAIVLVTLASRAAIEGGVIPEESYSLSDSYIRKIEESTDPNESVSIGRQAEYDYCLLVQEVIQAKKEFNKKEEINRWVNLCKDYIFSHLHDKISVPDIAEEIHINPNYLSTIFKKYEGISIHQFILQEKVKLAKNLLVYSNYSYIEIATYLGFSSQSHLGTQFRKITGETLHRYRHRHGANDFLGQSRDIAQINPDLSQR